MPTEPAAPVQLKQIFLNPNRIHSAMKSPAGQLGHAAGPPPPREAGTPLVEEALRLVTPSSQVKLLNPKREKSCTWRGPPTPTFKGSAVGKGKLRRVEPSEEDDGEGNGEPMMRKMMAATLAALMRSMSTWTSCSLMSSGSLVQKARCYSNWESSKCQPWMRRIFCASTPSCSKGRWGGAWCGIHPLVLTFTLSFGQGFYLGKDWCDLRGDEIRPASGRANDLEVDDEKVTFINRRLLFVQEAAEVALNNWIAAEHIPFNAVDSPFF
ncbi:hypothetical protein DFJ73DRAFT_760435 [Zopfochytrium polystomum]|nr:hypothetical protein DFJ73DRAFT_760435 [Zopfochytrium polystomum]